MEISALHQCTADSLKVAVLTTSYPLFFGSSSGIFVARLLEAMPENVAISVITPDSRARKTSVQCGSVHVFPVRYAPKSWQRLAHEPGGLPVALHGACWLRLLLPFLILTLALRTFWLARIHHLIHANWAFNGCLAGVAGLLTGCPVLTSLRGVDVTRAQKSCFARVVLRLAVGLSRIVVAVSSDMAVWLREAFPDAAEKIVVVENGVDMSFLAVSGERNTKQRAGAPVVACAGSLIPRKGHALLIRALALCTDAAWSLRLAGDGPERPALQRLATELGVAERIEFLGELPPEAMPDFLANADLFVLPSFSEGRPNALLEAMAAGLPVVASAIDGVRELVDDGRTGRTFPAGNEQVLAAVLLPLLQDATTRFRLGAAAHAEILRRQLTWVGAAEKYAGLYRQLQQLQRRH